MKSRIAKTCAALAVTGLAATAFGQVTLDDLASTAKINLPGITTDGGRAGLASLQRNVGGAATVDELEDVIQQWYWIGIGNAAEQSIDNLVGTVGPMVSTTSFNSSGGNRVRAMYGTGGDVAVRVQYELSGGSVGSFKNQMTRIATIMNNSNSTQSVRFYSYSNLALTNILAGPGSTIGFDPTTDETAVALNASGSRIRQFDYLPGSVVVSDSTTIANPKPTAIQIGDASTLLAALNDGSPTTLDGTNDFGDPQGIQTDEVAFAYQWNIDLAPGESFAIAEDLLITPEPSTFIVLGGSGILLALRRKTRRS